MKDNLLAVCPLLMIASGAGMQVAREEGSAVFFIFYGIMGFAACIYMTHYIDRIQKEKEAPPEKEEAK